MPRAHRGVILANAVAQLHVRARGQLDAATKVERLGFGHRQATDADAGQGLDDLVQLEWFDDGDD